MGVSGEDHVAPCPAARRFVDHDLRDKGRARRQRDHAVGLSHGAGRRTDDFRRAAQPHQADDAAAGGQLCALVEERGEPGGSQRRAQAVGVGVVRRPYGILSQRRVKAGKGAYESCPFLQPGITDRIFTVPVEDLPEGRGSIVASEQQRIRVQGLQAVEQVRGLLGVVQPAKVDV